MQGERRGGYDEHLKLVASTAQALREQYGVGRGDRVAIYAENWLEWIVAYWATVSLGGIVAALNGWWTREELLYGVELSEPKLLIADEFVEPDGRLNRVGLILDRRYNDRVLAGVYRAAGMLCDELGWRLK